MNFEDFLNDVKLSDSQYENFGPQAKVELLKVYVAWLKAKQKSEK